MAETTPNYDTDLLALHVELAGMEFTKDSTGQEGHRTYKYNDLPSLMRQISPALHRNNFTWSSKPSYNTQGQPTLRYTLRHVSGTVDEGEALLPAADGIKTREYGGMITYFRRYCITAHLGIVADEDDDAAKVQRAQQEVADSKQKPAAESKKQDIYMMVQKLGRPIEAFEDALGMKVEEMTNAQADEQIARLKTIIQRKLASANVGA